MCGIPGSGKSTWIKDNGLHDYSVSRDQLRLQYYGISYDGYGFESMPEVSEKFVYERYMEMVEVRMRNGSFVVLDNTHLKMHTINSIKQLAECYGYNIFIKIMNTPLHECLSRNKDRERLKFVSEEVIVKMNSNFKSFKENISKDYDIKRIEDLNEISAYDLSKSYIHYKSNDSIYVVGDIHGCYNELDKFLNNYESDLSSSKKLIFTGDFTDRGPENLKVLNKLIELSELNNVYFIEGNHEMSLREYSYSKSIMSKDFISTTKPQLDTDPGIKIRLRPLLMKLRTHILLSNDFLANIDKATNNIIICHGGISYDYRVLNGEVWRSPRSVIKGSDYPNGDMKNVAEKFHNSCSITSRQIHGHRPVVDENGVIQSAKTNPSVINLDGHVDQGGHLLVAHIQNKKIDILKY